MDALLVLVYGLIAVLTFRYKNQHRTLLNTVSVLIFLFLIQQIWTAYLDLNAITFLVSWIAAGILLITAYSIRLNSRPRLQAIDYLKLISIILLTTLPLGSIDLSTLNNSFLNTLQLISFLTPGLIMVVFIYDRFIMKPKNMKKTFLITLIIQTLFIFALLLFALTQKINAEQTAKTAVMQRNSCIEEIEKHNSDISELKVRISVLENELNNCRQQ